MDIKWNIWVLLSIFLGSGWCNNNSCPFNEQCTCTSVFSNMQYTDIICEKIPLAQLPDLPDLDIHRLKVTETGLMALENNDMGKLRTRTLILDNNSIYFIANSTFIILNKTLEELSLNYNHLYEIPLNALSPLEVLKILKLDGNQISSVVVDWMNLRNTLLELHLSNNDLDSVPLDPATSLSNLKVLNEINLASNLLISLEANSFPNSLKSLNASNNYIKDFPHDLLGNLQELTKLDLSYNSLVNIPSYKYDGKINLNNLDLSHNGLIAFKKVFSKTVKVNSLDLSANKIASIEKEAFSGLDCNKINLSCNKLSALDDSTFSGIESTLESLNLSQNKFLKVPSGLKELKNLKSLNLAKNSLLKLKTSSYHFGGLQKLSASGNLLSLFPTEALKQFRSLKELDLSYNKIAEVIKSDFKTWGQNLEKILFQSNSFFYLGNSTFEHASKLTELSLSYNPIGDIFTDTFKNLDKLQKLDISFGLKSYGIPSAILVKSLNYLALDNNNINSISKDLTKLESIETLILDFNRIKDLESSTFDSKAHKFLKDLRLSFNFITKIDSNTFSLLNNLQFLSLHNNQIFKIAEFAFINLPHNISIYLSNNKIEEIAKSAFSNIPKLKNLDLHNNNFQTFDYNIFQSVTNKSDPMTLNLSKNRIETLKVPDYQRAPVYIENLDLSHNKISRIPEKIVEIQPSLKYLDLGYNEISSLESKDFYSMVELESLILVHNKIVTIKDDSFVSLKMLRTLNISHNHLDQLQAGGFKNLVNLKILDLSFNNIATISKSAFDNTKIEWLYLSNNKITSIVSSVFYNVGKTLRLLDLSFNQIGNLEGNFLQNSPKLQELDLSHNNLTNDTLVIFKTGSNLLKVDFSGNYLATVPNDAFSSASQLRFLNLAKTGLHVFPDLNLPSLVHLNVSENKIKNLTESLFSGLPKLRDLILRNNNISALNDIKWIQIPSLKSLDLSYNPIKVLDKPCFFGLYNLRELNIQNLNDLEHIDSGIFMDLDKLTSLKIDFKKKNGLSLNKTLPHFKFLSHLSLLVKDAKLSNELPTELPNKLLSLEISGKELKSIDSDALRSLKTLQNFKLLITRTGIRHFPKHFLNPYKNKGFTIDLSNNELHSIGPEILYYTYGDIRRYGTKAFPGGINVQGNALECGCEVKWLAEWLRRYLVETLNTNNLSVESRLRIIESMNQLLCYDKKTQQNVPVLTFDLSSDQLLCGIVLNFPKVRDANAAGSANNVQNMSILLSLLLIVFSCLSTV